MKIEGSVALVTGANRTFHKPPTCVAYPDAEAAFTVASRRRGVTTRVLRAGDDLDPTSDELEVAAS